MLHGFSFLPDSDHRSGIAAPDYFSMALELSSIADSACLAYVKMTEHYLGAYGGYCPSPLSFLSAVAARTSRIRLMTGCLLPVFHHPVQLASETAMIDALSGGRLDVGFARAYLPYEFDALGVRMDGSRDRFDETVDAVVRLWRETDVCHSGHHYSFSRVTTQPRPVQPGGPPVWIAAVKTVDSFVRAGRARRGLLITPSLSPLQKVAELVRTYRSNYDSSDGSSPRVLVSLPVHVGRTGAEAVAQADPRLRRYLDVWADAADSWSTRSSTDYRGYSGMAYAIRSVTPERFRDVGAAIVGSVEDVVDQIERMREIVDIDGILWQVDYGGVRRDDAVDSATRLCSDVIPRLSAPRAPAAVR